MAGHSKWSSIKRKKKANDEKRGKLFSKLANDIRVSLKDNSNLNQNFKFKNAVSRALEKNISKSIINKIVSNYAYKPKDRVLYSANCLYNSIFIVECYQDNKMKLISELRYIFSQNYGVLIPLNKVDYMFDRINKILLSDIYNEDVILYHLRKVIINKFIDDSFFVSSENIDFVFNKLKSISKTFSCLPVLVPKKPILLYKDQYFKLLNLKKKIEENVYVSNVFTNVLDL